LGVPDLSRYRPNVGVVLANAEGRVWLGRRADTPGPHNWQFPQGGVDKGERPADAALRELREETGARSVTLLGQTSDWLAYDFPRGHRRSNIAERWIGQKQLWFAFRFLGDDSEIDLGAHDEIEFAAWRWGSFQDALDGVVPFKRDIYRQVIETFAPLT
jgi:putative (di)nucleoside polyphosphate hydrolase